MQAIWAPQHFTLGLRRYVYQTETGEEARLAPVTVEVPMNQSIPYLKRRLEHVSFGGHQVLLPPPSPPPFTQGSAAPRDSGATSRGEI